MTRAELLELCSAVKWKWELHGKVAAGPSIGRSGTTWDRVGKFESEHGSRKRPEESGWRRVVCLLVLNQSAVRRGAEQRRFLAGPTETCPRYKKPLCMKKLLGQQDIAAVSRS